MFVYVLLSDTFHSQGAILKSADSLVGEELTFAVFVPTKEPYFFKCLNAEQKSMWMGVLNKYAASTEWSTSSMVKKKKRFVFCLV